MKVLEGKTTFMCSSSCNWNIQVLHNLGLMVACIYLKLKPVLNIAFSVDHTFQSFNLLGICG